MKLEENNIIVKLSLYKTVYKCDDSIVKVFNEGIRSQMYLTKL